MYVMCLGLSCNALAAVRMYVSFMQPHLHGDCIGAVFTNERPTMSQLEGETEWSHCSLSVSVVLSCMLGTVNC